MLLSITVISATYAAEDLSFLRKAPGYQLGCVDRVVLKKAIAEKGYAALKTEIEQHIFEKKWITHEPEIAHKERIPLTIVQQCKRDDDSALSKIVFGSIRSIYNNDMGPVFDTNRLNGEMQEERIDHCTSAESVDEDEEVWNAEIVQIKTLFCHKTSLLAALEEFKQ